MRQPEDKQHLADLSQTVERMRQHALKMNPFNQVCIRSKGWDFFFFLFLVHHRGIEIDKNKARAITITEAPPLKNKKELQRLIGQINFFRRFFSNLAGKLQPLSPC